MEENKKTIREMILNSRNKAGVDIAYNINKMCFLPLIKYEYNLNYDNQLRIIANILKNNYKSGTYISEYVMKERGMELIETENKPYGVVYEYLKEIDEETGKKAYKFLILHNEEQIIDGKEKLEEYYNNKKYNFSRPKYNLRRNNIEAFFEKNQFDMLEKILFIAIIRIRIGKEIDYGYRYDEDEKKILIEIVKNNDDYIRNVFHKTSKAVDYYFMENVIEEENKE